LKLFFSKFALAEDLFPPQVADELVPVGALARELSGRLVPTTLLRGLADGVGRAAFLFADR
jgi:hypothetical protein